METFMFVTIGIHISAWLIYAIYIAKVGINTAIQEAYKVSLGQ